MQYLNTGYLCIARALDSWVVYNWSQMTLFIDGDSLFRVVEQNMESLMLLVD